VLLLGLEPVTSLTDTSDYARLRWLFPDLSDDRLLEVRAEIRGNARVTPGYLFMNAVATLIAGFGLYQNSPAVIIGAMLIAMLMGPIQGIALSLAEADAIGFWHAFRSELLGVVWVLAFASVVGFLLRDLPIGSEILGRTKPTILDLCVALAGGAAAGYAAVSKRVSGAVVGVAISTALVPPLTACALLMVRGLTGPAFGAFLNFFTNFVTIALSSMVVFFIAGFRPAPFSRERRRGAVLIGSAHIAIVGLLMWYLYGTFRETFGVDMLRVSLRQTLYQELEQHPGARLVSVTLGAKDNRPIAWVVVRTPQALTPEQTGRIEQALIRTAGRDLDLHVRSVITVEATSEGYAYPALPNDIDGE
jgi:uncharacterized hydrophobic protein (TIGR00271 family)